MNIFSLIYKKLFRNILLFSGILMIIITISIIFTGINIGSNIMLISSMEERIKDVFPDMQFTFSNISFKLNFEKLEEIKNKINNFEEISNTEYYISSLIFLNNKTIKFDNITIDIIQIIYLNKNSEMINEIKIIKGKFDLKNGSAILIKYNVKNDDLKFLNKTIKLKNYNIKIISIAEINEKFAEILGFIYKSFTYSRGIIIEENFFKNIENKIFLLVNKYTFKEILQSYSESRIIYFEYLVLLNREKVIDFNNLDKTIDNLRELEKRIKNTFENYFDIISRNKILFALESLRLNLFPITLLFVFTSLPLIFIAIYLGKSLGDLTLEIRKKEIALLKLRGLSYKKVFFIFFIHSIIITILGIFIGYFLSSLVLFYVFGINILIILKELINNQIALTITFVLAFLISLTIIIPPIRRAVNYPIIYSLGDTYIEHEEKPYKKLRVWLALILGSYKLLIWAFNINLNVLFLEVMRTGNFVLIIAISILMLIDNPLTFLAPFLFLYGISKILAYHGAKLQANFINFFRFFLKDLTIITSKAISRKASRNSVMIFVISLIIFYSFYNIINASINEDFIIRNSYFETESDIKVNLKNTNKAEEFLNKIINLKEVKDATIVYKLLLFNHEVYAIDPSKYFKVAFYEKEWFLGKDFDKIINELQNVNSIVLKIDFKEIYNLGEKIKVVINIGKFYFKHDLIIIGFVGLEKEYFDSPQISKQYISVMPSLINYKLVKNYKNYLDSIVLIKLKSIDYTNAVLKEILKDENVKSVITFKEAYERNKRSMLFFSNPSIVNFEVITSLMLVTIGIISISIINLKEKYRNLVLQHIKGLDRKQLFKISLFSMIGILIFSILIGIVTSIVTNIGYISIYNSFAGTLITLRLVILQFHLIQMLGIIALIFLSLIIPTLIFIKRIQARVEEVI